MKSRNLGLDLVRGIAIILVLFNHSNLDFFLSGIGWVGVEIFFVLSGFLIGGLLIKENSENGRINYFQFLIKRGFKIYPNYYFFIFSYVLYYYLVVDRNLESDFWGKLLNELLFIQNYRQGIFFHTWSLAVEEHFYIILPIFFLVMGFFNAKNNFQTWAIVVLIIVILCISFRVYNSIHFPYSWFRNYFNTHIRIDSLFFGVLIAFLLREYENKLLIIKNWKWIWFLAGLLSIFCFSLIFKRDSFFMTTFGYSALYISSAIVILSAYFTSSKNLVYRLLAKIGKYSYSIYLWHLFIITIYYGVLHRCKVEPNLLINICALIPPVFAGIFFFNFLEKPFLVLRDKVLSK